MSKKSPAVNFFYKKISTTKKSKLYAELEDSPLTVHEFAFISDVIEGFTITELSEKFHKTPSRISQWKREVCEKIHDFEMATVRH